MEEDDYVDPFNVDDGLLQDDNEIEDFPDEDEDEEDREEVTTPTPPDDDDDDDFNPQDDAETIDDDEEREEPKYFHCLFGGYGPFGVVNSIGHLGRYYFYLLLSSQSRYRKKKDKTWAQWAIMRDQVK